jgi:hypothetical protein
MMPAYIAAVREVFVLGLGATALAFVVGVFFRERKLLR